MHGADKMWSNCGCFVGVHSRASLEPRLSVPDFVSQLWRKMRDKTRKAWIRGYSWATIPAPPSPSPPPHETASAFWGGYIIYVFAYCNFKKWSKILRPGNEAKVIWCHANYAQHSASNLRHACSGEMWFFDCSCMIRWLCPPGLRLWFRLRLVGVACSGIRPQHLILIWNDGPKSHSGADAGCYPAAKPVWISSKGQWRSLDRDLKEANQVEVGLYWLGDQRGRGESDWRRQQRSRCAEVPI